MKLKGRPTPEQQAELKAIKEELAALEEHLKALEFTRDQLLKDVPNPPHPSVPDGDTEEDAVEIRRVGEPPNLADPKEHTEIGRFDMERAAKVSGSRFGYIIGDTALVALALYRLALDRLAAAGFLPVIPPVLVREEAMYGTGFFPTERTNIYAIEKDELYLIGTSEVSRDGLPFGGDPRGNRSCPALYAGFSTCYRREAGAAGKDTKGLYRIHQFNKVEMYSYVHPDESWDEHERILELEESILRELGLPYRVVNVAAGDLGAPAAKKYDCEAWFPAQGRYREVDVGLERDRLPGAPAQGPLPRRAGHRLRAHAERHRGRRPCAARDPRELPGRRARCAAPVRRTGARQLLTGGPPLVTGSSLPSWGIDPSRGSS